MKNILKLTAILFAITAVVAAALAGVNQITAEKIDAIKLEKTRAAVAAVLPDETVDGGTKVNDNAVKTLYRGTNGCAMEVEVNGYGGAITMMVGVSKEGKVLGVQIVSHTESAGLGAKAAADSAEGKAFRDSFLGLEGSVSVSKDGGEADTLTSATITSRAVAKGVSAALEYAATLNWNEEGAQ